MTAFITSPRFGLLGAALLLAALVGCGGPPTAKDVRKLLDEVHDELLDVATLESVEVTKTEKTGDGSDVVVDFIAVEKLTKDFFSPVEVIDAYKHYKFDPAALTAAEERLVRLREPERAAALAKLPKQPPLEHIYVKTKSVGDEFQWAGKATGRSRGGVWMLDKYDGELSSFEFDESSLSRDALPPDAIVVTDPGDNAITAWIASATPFIQCIDAAEKAVEARLKREAEALDAATAPGKMWQVAWPIGDRPSLNVSATFIAPLQADAPPMLLFANPADPFERSVWLGERYLPPPPEIPFAGEPAVARPQPDGWSIRLRAALAGDKFPPTADGAIHLTPGAEGALAWSSSGKSGTFALDEAAKPLWNLADSVRMVEGIVQPGSVLVCELERPNLPPQKVQITFIGIDPEARTLRACLELPDAPAAVATMTGSYSLEPAAVYGRAFTLTYSAAAADDLHRAASFGQPNREKTLTFQMVPGGKTPLLARDQDGAAYRFGSNGRVVLASPDEQWKSALMAGRVWSGDTVEPNQPGGGQPRMLRLRLTIAETRDDLGYVRVIAESTETPDQFCIFEGALDRDLARVGGYALSLKRKLASPVLSSTGDHPDKILGRTPDAVLKFRLSPSGQSLIGPATGRETAVLLGSPDPASPPLDRQSFSALWREKLARFSRWRGELVNTSANQHADVDFIVSEIDAEGRVEATLAVLKQPKTRTVYKGVLTLDDASVNGFALKLVKQGMGEGQSVAFGAAPAELHLRLTPDGGRLLGMVGQPPQEWREFLDLKLQAAVERKPKEEEGKALPGDSKPE